MLISKIYIHNYRGIHDEEFELKNYSLIVGPNNSGKSTAINAIRAFYEKDGFKYNHDADFPFIQPPDKESWIEIIFKLTDDEMNSLSEDYKNSNNTLIVRKYFETNIEMGNGKSASGYIFGYRSDGSLSNDPFYGAKNVQSGKFGNIIFIPAVSKVDEHTKLTGPSALRDLVLNIMSSTISQSQNYKEFKNHVSSFSEGICLEETKEGYSIKNFEDELNKSLEKWGVKFQIQLETR